MLGEYSATKLNPEPREPALKIQVPGSLLVAQGPIFAILTRCEVGRF